jgi:ABC-type transport system involved in cytochrome bd biosynthesis fused ATPase/permease subunit
VSDDPVLARRARIARLTELGQRVGYSLFGIAIVVFVVGFVVGYSDALVAVIVTSLLVGSLVLAPSIVFAYGVKAAEREERERRAGG